MTGDLALGRRFVEAIGARDFDAVERLLARNARLRALVPTTLREDEGAGAVVARMRLWWEPARELELLESEVEPLADRVRVRYRLRLFEEEAQSVMEQSAYLTVEGDRIAAVNLVCTGKRPQPEP